MYTQATIPLTEDNTVTEVARYFEFVPILVRVSDLISAVDQFFYECLQFWLCSCLSFVVVQALCIKDLIHLALKKVAWPLFPVFEILLHSTL
ncbi:hypothetical protein CEXT_720691 [Caerostris extrusa]|uniref:Uncharacterized protein n=1 Tax=Caerostris extrusa TaxID=172846 RepID=A0AAV4QX08_CAEEX|nr:hypothetical protein CEXT_720691 [Caerostris extrusa]